MNFKQFLNSAKLAADIIATLPSGEQHSKYLTLFKDLSPQSIIEMASFDPKLLAFAKDILIDLMRTAIETDIKNESIKAEADAAAKVLQDESKHDNETEDSESDKDSTSTQTSAWERMNEKIHDHLVINTPYKRGVKWGDYAESIEKEAADEANAQIAARNAQLNEVARKSVATASSVVTNRPISYADLACEFPNLPSNQPVVHNHQMNHQPVHHQPVHHQPVHHQPVHHQPVHHQQFHQQPVHQQPVHQQQVNRQPMSQRKTPTTTCDRWTAGCCPNPVDKCWFLHKFDDEGFPINWGPRKEVCPKTKDIRYIYTPRKNSPWKHYICPKSGQWVNEYSANGSWPGTIYDDDTHKNMMTSDMRRQN